MEFCASIQVQCKLTVLCSETRPNAKPENVVGKRNERHRNQKTVGQKNEVLTLKPKDKSKRHNDREIKK